VEMIACVVCGLWLGGWGGGLFGIIGITILHFGKRGLQAVPRAITEVLGGIFGEMRRHLASFSCRRYDITWIMAFSGDDAAQEQNHAGGDSEQREVGKKRQTRVLRNG
jgi:hypothetical protein